MATPLDPNFGWQDEHPKSYHQLLEPLIARLLPDKQTPILDIGCGNGYFANRLIDQGYTVYGIDTSPDGIAIANRQHPDHFFRCDVTCAELPAPLRAIPFRTVLCMEVIEHLYSPRTMVCFARELLLRSGGGELLVTTPYHGYLKNLTIALADRMDYHLSALWEGGHIKFWSKRTLTRLLSDAGYRDIAIRGAGRIPYLWRHMVCRAEL